MASSAIFISAADARQNPIRETVVHDEARAIESAILASVRNGFFQAVIDDGSPMTSSQAVNAAVASIDLQTDQLTILAHPFKTGDMITVSTTGTLPAPLDSAAFYWVIYVDTDHIKLAASMAAANSNLPISLDFSVGVTNIEVDDAGSGYLEAPYVNIDPPLSGTAATAVAYLQPFGQIDNIPVLSPGQGFTAIPSIGIDAQGIGAVAGTVRFKAVSVSIAAAGSNYRVGDVLSIVGGSGSATTAMVTAVDNLGAVQTVALGNPGSYTALPALSAVTTTVQPGGGNGCLLNLSMGLASIAVADGGFGYTAPPAVLVSGNARASAVVRAGVVTDILVQEAGSGYTTVPTIALTSGSGAAARAHLQPTGVGSYTVQDDGGATYTQVPSVQVIPYGSGATAGMVRMRILTATITNGGRGYSVGETLLVAGGAGSDGASILVTKVGTFGEIISYSLVTSGSYTTLPILDNNSVLGGSGSSATFTLTTGVLSIEVADGGSLYQGAPVVVIAPSDGYGVDAAAYALMAGDSVGEIVVTNSGSGYRTIPSVSLENGNGAAAEAVLTATGIDSLSIENQGDGYSYALIRFIGDGRDAEALAVISGGKIVDITMVQAGTGYTYPPSVVISGDGIGAGATANLIPTSVAQVIPTSVGYGYTAPPQVVIDGTAIVRADLKPTGVARIQVTDGGEDWSSLPMIYVIPSLDQVGSVVSPATTSNISRGVDHIAVTDAGSGYQSVPSVNLSAPRGADGSAALATAAIGSGTGTLVLSWYPPARDYWSVWKNQQPSDALFTRPYVDRMDTVINYFTSLGYSITRQTNPATGNTIQWQVMW